MVQLGFQMRFARFGRMAAAGLVIAALAGCAEVQQKYASLRSPCHDESLALYFDSGSDALTDAGSQLVGVTAKRLRSCKVKELRLIGLADPVGTPANNLELSQRRADHVLDAFVRAGTPVPKYTLVARGDQGAVAANGAVEPLHRRVDVTLVVGR